MRERQRRDPDGYDDGNGDEFEYGSTSPRFLAYRMRQMETRMKSLEDKFDKLTQRIVGAVVTVSVLLTVYVLTSQGSS